MKRNRGCATTPLLSKPPSTLPLSCSPPFVVDNRWDSSPTKGSISASPTCVGGLHDLARSTIAMHRNAVAASNGERRWCYSSHDPTAPPVKPSRVSAPPLGTSKKDFEECLKDFDAKVAKQQHELTVSLPRLPRRRSSWELTDNEFQGRSTADLITKVLEELDLSSDDEQDAIASLAVKELSAAATVAPSH